MTAKTLAHGSPGLYKRGCRCEVCVKSRTRRAKQRALQLRGRPALINASRVWAYMDKLQAEGWTPELIGTAAGIDPYVVRYRRNSCRIDTASALMSVTRAGMYAVATGLQAVPSVGTIRRIQALQAIGWSIPMIGPERRLTRILNGNGMTTIDAYRFVLGVYDRLSMTPGPSDQGRNRAKRFGLLPPLCWDDESIDDPDARPAGGRRTARDALDGKRAELLDAIEGMTDRGESAISIAAKCKVSTRTVERARAELLQYQLDATG